MKKKKSNPGAGNTGAEYLSDEDNNSSYTNSRAENNPPDAGRRYRLVYGHLSPDRCSLCDLGFDGPTRSGLTHAGKVAIAGECCWEKIGFVDAYGYYIRFREEQYDRK